MTIDVALFYKDLQIGGVQRMMIVMANAFAERGLSVDLVVGEADAEARALCSEAVRLVDLKCHNRLLLGWRLIRYLRANQPRNIYSADPNYNATMLIAKGMSGVGGRSIISERSDTRALFRNTPFGLFKLSILLSPLFYRLADKIVAVSRGTADSLASFTGIARDRIDVIYNPAYRSDIDNLSAEQVVLPWNETRREDLIISAGRLSPQKNYTLLINAFAIAKRSNRRLKLVIVGEGPERPAIEKIVDREGLRDDIWLAGSQQNPFKWLARAGVFALSSKWEGFGNVVVEALACGCTVVSTDCPSGPAEILANGKFGFLSPVDDVGLFADSLLKAVRDPIPMAAARERAKSFSTATATEKYMGLFAR
jgi:glycosyltransferase involved in cell wall biosynthesis